VLPGSKKALLVLQVGQLLVVLLQVVEKRMTVLEGNERLQQVLWLQKLPQFYRRDLEVRKLRRTETEYP